MKEPPIAVANRTATTTQFTTQGQQQAAVMMVYGLESSTMNTDKLFNLVCLYGKFQNSTTNFLSMINCR
jgi:heterogeneous nuclear ribonucleoprotein L